MLQPKQSEEPLVRKRSRTASDSLDTWLCEPTTIESKEVQRPASSNSSFSSCTTQKDSKTLSLEVLENKEGGGEEEEEDEVLSRESVCVTPKAKKYRIPVVDVDICPPAPKKARRLTVVCSRGRERSKFLQKLSFSASFLV